MNDIKLKEQILTEINFNEVSNALFRLIDNGKLNIESFRKVFPLLSSIKTNMPATYHAYCGDEIHHDNEFAKLDELCISNNIAIRIESKFTDGKTYDFGAVVGALFDNYSF